MSDWDKEDRGGYRPQPHRETVIKSLSAKQYQSLRHLLQNTGLTADEVEPILQVDSDISFQMVGVIPVYFLKVNQPKGKLFNSGYNSFLLKDANEKPAAETRNINKASPTQDKLDLAVIEQCGFEGKTIKETAQILGIPESSCSFYLYSKSYPKYGEAYKKGKNRRNCEKKNNLRECVIMIDSLSNDEIERLVNFS